MKQFFTLAALLSLSAIVSAQTLTLEQGTVLTRRVVSDNVGYPAALALDPTGALWLTDRVTGRVLRIDPTTGAASTVLEIPLTSRPDVPGVTGGVFGLAIHPRFAEGEKYVFVSTTMADDRLVVERYWYSGDKLSNPHQVFEAVGVPHTLGLALEVLHDGTLLISVASFDTFDPIRLDNVNGKIIRVDMDGNAVASNPFYDASKPTAPISYVYSYGHRNPLGIVQVPQDHPTLAGAVYSTECGPFSFDEINRIDRGNNYGWLHTAGYCSGDMQGYTCPLATLNQAPAGLAYYGSTAIPEWKNSVLVGTLRGNGMVVAHIDDHGRITNVDPERPTDDVLDVSNGGMVDLGINGNRPRVIDVAVSADGRVYAALYEGGNVRRGEVIALENPVVHSPLSVTADTETGSEIHVSPLPVGDVLTVSLREPYTQRWTASIVDLNGRVLTTATYSAATTRVTLPTASLAPGAYLLVVRQPSGVRTAPFIR